MPEEEEVQDQENQESADAKKGKGKLLKFILIPVIVAVQAVVAYFLVFNYLVEDPEKEVAKKEEKKVGQFFELKDVVVNPAGTLGRRFLVVEIGLETDMEKVITEAESKEIWIRDAVISLLVKKTPEQLLNIENRDTIKQEILKVLNSQMSEGKFDKLYFTKYLMQ